MPPGLTMSRQVLLPPQQVTLGLSIRLAVPAVASGKLLVGTPALPRAEGGFLGV